MKKLLDKAVIQLQSDNYIGLLIIIAPLLNFLTGINIDLYTPSLPEIAHYYGASIIIVKNTITATMIGFAIGCIIFGTIIDIFGRRRIILFGLMVYTVSSLLALACTNIGEFPVGLRKLHLFAANSHRPSRIVVIFIRAL